MIAAVLVTTWIVLTGLLVLVGEGIERSTAIMSMDRRITTFVVNHRTPALDQLMKAVTWTGSWRRRQDWTRSDAGKRRMRGPARQE
jgi:hypothetical protein